MSRPRPTTDRRDGEPRRTSVRAERRAALGNIAYPPELPVVDRRDDIAAAITTHPVVIVAGETGSGKTTQLPKICLDLGRGVEGLIGHTQPRRIAARTVAERIAEELGTELGDAVGYQVRFTERFDNRTLVKVMTDGILLNEIQRDRDLRRYDTIILDEAHERSLNIDFLLGYLKRLLPRRSDLKLIVTSATIDPERFARHFDGAPVVEVSGRMYPVEMRYRDPIDEDRGRDQPMAIVDAVQELIGEGPGDVLVFLSGEREIRDAADALRAVRPSRVVDEFDVLPLYARLSVAEQHRVFASHNRRRIVLATNVAETSLTVPGIRYVVDTGYARISRYSARTKVQRLPIEPISQASARQRAGRCGRVAAGVCIRLYTEEDFEGRPEFTDPEIIRTNLASVILQMTALRLGRVQDFPFIDPPQSRSVAAGVQLLQELGAIGRGRVHGLTPVGRRLASIPIDPRLGRMILAAGDHGCVREICVLAAALSIQDPRERPTDKEEQADAAHRPFVDKDSDFATWLNLWRHLREQQKALSSNQFRRMCRNSYLNYLRVREWQDLDAQLRRVAKSLDLTVNKQPAAFDAIHRALMTGLLSHLGMRDPESRDYQGARNTRFAIFPGSGLFKKQPDWVMSAELVETSRLWARANARVEPEWAEEIGAHLVSRSYSEPHWEKKRGAVMAYERVTLYGLPIVPRRKIGYARIDPALSRELFIRQALVEGDWETRHWFFAKNQRLLAEAAELEDRARRRGIVVDDATLFDFYDARIPEDVVSAQHFDAWWKKRRRTDPDLLTFTPELVVSSAAGAVDAAAYPEVWRHDDNTFDLRYRFEPGAVDDGVTIDIPAASLAQLDPVEFSWPVPGQRLELVTALLRSLPKAIRVHVIPAPNHARAFLEQTSAGAESLLDALARYVRRVSGLVVAADAWDLDRVPGHLRWSYRIVDDSGGTLGVGKDLAELREQFLPAAARSIARAAHAIERDDIVAFEPLPATFVSTKAGQEIRGYPAYTVVNGQVAVRVFSTAAEQADEMHRGVRQLVVEHARSPVDAYARELGNERKLALVLAPHPTVAAFLDDCYACVVDHVIEVRGLPTTADEFERLVTEVDADAAVMLADVVEVAVPVLQTSYEIGRRLSGRAELAMLPALADMKEQHSGLVFTGFVAETGWDQLRHLTRYLTAIGRRLDSLAGNLDRDRQAMDQIHSVEDQYRNRIAALPPGRRPGPGLRAVRWLIEELRVSLFAQSLGTAGPVSVRRIQRRLDQL
jgi:ATP-dependent helicase HrpA